MGKPENTPPNTKRKAPRTAWKPGECPNPGGFTKEKRAQRKAIAEALDEAFTVREIIDGKEISKDLLVEAIKIGVQEREPSLIRLACEYRWGKPVQPIDLNPEGMDDSTLLEALEDLFTQLKQEKSHQHHQEEAH